MHTLWYVKNKSASTGDTYIFPKGFNDAAVIIFEIETGDPVNLVNGRRTFRFDTSRILITQAADPKGMVDQQFYFEDSMGNLTKLNPYAYYLKKNAREDSTSIQVFGWHEKGHSSNSNSCDYKFMTFYVCNLKELNRMAAGFKRFKLLEKIESKLCR
jgi:hypothetical protein